MLLKQTLNLLPKKVTDGVALKTILSNIQLDRFRGFKKLNHNIVHFSKFTKLSLGGLLLLYLTGYQPTMAIPPLAQSKVLAQNTQQESINSTKLAQPFNLPHPGYLSTKFSSWHPGVDIATGLGMPIHPVAAGKVVEVTMGFWGLGHYVVVEHEQNFRSTYGHMGKVYVKVGDTVGADSYLGEVGMTGHTTGPHTHLELTFNGQYIDPQTVLPAISDWPQSAGVAPKGQGEEQKAQPEVKKTEKIENKPAIKKLGLISATPTTDSTKLSRLLLPLPGQF